MDIDYKTAKEAFVADNPGESIWSIQVTSFTALTAYGLYAVISKRTRGPLVDYLTTVLPLLLSVTWFSSTRSAMILQASMIGLAALVHFLWPVDTNTTEPDMTHAKSKKSQGKWLDESDSEEEPSQPVYTSSTSYPLSRLSTSSSTDASSSSRPISPIDPGNPSTPTSTLSPDRAEKPEISRRTFKRRHSPTPSTHTHTAIDVMQSPDAQAFVVDNNPAYPRHPRARTPTGPDGYGSARKGILPFLSVYRAHMMIMTIHCILAVDFPIFPRVQGKCEDFGTSLMDVGVGSFVFSMGLVSARSVTAAASGNMVYAVFKALKKASPILFLGLIRVLMVKGTEYPEHVTEYGVHWNFFFTLGLMPVLGITISPLRSYIGWTPLALIVAASHQIALSQFGLQSWILSPDRLGLIGMNKEGLVSLPGYLAIYALGLGIGQHVSRDPLAPTASHQGGGSGGVVETRAEHIRSRMEKRRSESAMELFGYSVGWWMLLWGVRLAGVQVSRRMANLPYILWTAAYNTTFLLGYLTIELLSFAPGAPNPGGSAVSAGSNTPYGSYLPQSIPPLLDAINNNGLAVFLIANLLTGLVNLCVKTMFVGDLAAMGVLGAYSFGVCAIAWVGRGMRLKI